MLHPLALLLLCAVSQAANAFRLNCGGGELAGVLADTAEYRSTANAIFFDRSVNRAPSVYNSHSYAPNGKPLVYTIPAANVPHTVTLRFSELFNGATVKGGRVFNITLNGVQVATNVDVFTEAGALFAPFVIVRTDVFPVGGVIQVRVVPVVENAMISGIDIIKESPTLTPSVAPQAASVRINAGGGVVGDYIDNPVLYQTSGAVRNFDRSAGRTPSIYNSQAFMPAMAPLEYKFNVSNVAHTVILHFSEIFAGVAVAGGRKISILVNTKTVAVNADIWTLAGNALFAPVTFTETGVLPVNGVITVRIIAKTQNAIISGIEIIEGVVAPTPTPTPTPTAGTVLRLNAGGIALADGTVADSPLYNSASESAVFAFRKAAGREPSVYNSHAYSLSGSALIYKFAVSDAPHIVTLRFTEIFSGAAAAGARLLELSVNGVVFKTNVDVYTLAGSKLFAPVDFVRYEVYPVSGFITISVRGLKQNAMISGIDLEASVPLVNSGAWRLAETTGFVVRRHESCAVMVAGKVYIIGGRNTRATSVYDPKTRVWTTRSVPPVELNHMQCVAYKERYVYVAGAWYGAFPKELTHNVTYVYDTIDDLWSSKPGMGARARGGGASVIYGGKLYHAFGNRGGHGGHATTLAEFDVYDFATETWTALPDAPHARDHVGGAIVGNRLCVGGGRDGGVPNFWETPVLPINCYNFHTNLWEVHANITEGRAGAATGATCQGLLMVAGGEGREPGTPGQAFFRVDLYNPETRSFSPYLNLTDSRHGSGLAIADCSCGNIYLPSGSGNLAGSPELSTMEVWSPDGVVRDC